MNVVVHVADGLSVADASAVDGAISPARQIAP